MWRLAAAKQKDGAFKRSFCGGRNTGLSSLMRSVAPRKPFFNIDNARAFANGCLAQRTRTNPLELAVMSKARRASELQRRALMSGPNIQYEAVVVGAGPAGITCVGNMLERQLSNILWVDDSFNGGRINRLYREVPSNTKVKLFVEFGTDVAPFRKIVRGAPSRSRWDEPSASDSAGSSAKDDKLKNLRDLNQDQGCQLSNAADMCLMLTEGLRNTSGVVPQEGRVVEAVLDESPTIDPALRWTVRLWDEGSSSTTTVKSRRLIFCTGASPNNDPLPVHMPGIQNLDLDTALSPSRLAETLAPLGPTTIAVIGASHSAILVLMNLYKVASSMKPDLRVRWLTRHPLRYAQEMDGWILRDNTGLKGEAADFARANLEPETMTQSDVSKYITRIDYERGDEEGTFEETLPGCNFYIQAIGYNADPLPSLKTAKGKEITPYFDHEKGSFNYVRESDDGTIGDLVKVPGMYGAGIAWPERVVDPHGNVEMAVGFKKFMKFVKRVSPAWD
jgi:hypothetical protein